MLTQTFIDTVILGKEASLSAGIIAAIALIYIYKIVFTYLKSAVLAKLQLKMSLITNYQLVHRILHLKGNFYEQRQAGELANRTDNNNDVNTFLAGNFAKVLVDILESVFYFGLMFSYSRTLTMIGMAGVALNVLISHFFLPDPAFLLSRAKRCAIMNYS